MRQSLTVRIIVRSQHELMTSYAHSIDEILKLSRLQGRLLVTITISKYLQNVISISIQSNKTRKCRHQNLTHRRRAYTCRRWQRWRADHKNRRRRRLAWNSRTALSVTTQISALCMGGDTEGLGDGPPKFEVGTAHASVPPIFGEVVLLEAPDIRKEKNVIFCEIDVFRQEKSDIVY